MKYKSKLKIAWVTFCALILCNIGLYAQTITVKGHVVDENGEPMPGVNVRIKGTTIGAVTDFAGNFADLKAPNADAVIVFSFIGFVTQEFVVGNQTNIQVNMKEDTRELDEVVVVGYGSQKKVTVVGAITTITTKELKQSPTTNLSNALAGRMPGLLVNQFKGGEPGVDQSDIFVRGTATYNTDNNAQRPIMIVDGVERDFTYLSPDEVETITILKDASSTAVYGVRGANGVILVTTKRGKSEKPSVTLKAAFGRSAPIKFPEYLGSADYAVLYNEARDNDKNMAATRFTQSAIENFRNAKGDNSDGLGYNTDLFDYAFKPSYQQDYSLTVTGGTQRVRYFVLASYMAQNGNYKHTDLGQYNTNAKFVRYNFRSNIDVNLTDDWYVRLDLGGRVQDRIAPGTTAADVVELANTTPPFYPIWVEDNDDPANKANRALNPDGMLFGNQIYRRNIQGELGYRGFQDEYKTYMQGSFIMGYKLDKILSGLKVEGQFSYDSYAGNTVKRDVSTESEGYRTYNGYAIFYPKDGGIDYYMDVATNGQDGHYTGEYAYPRLTQNKTLNNNVDQHAPERRTYGHFSINYARSFGNHNVTGLLLGNRAKKVKNNEVPYASQGVSARFTYNYAERYLLEISGAYNGSENFAKGKRYGLFPAFSAGWIVSNEGFFNSEFINYLKLRGSFGLVGNDQIKGSRFAYLQYYNKGGNYQGGTDLNAGFGEGWSEGDLANTELTWEKAKKYNIGIDFKTFKNQLSIVADFFYEDRYDIITSADEVSKNYSQVVGKKVPPLNIGKVANKGIDLEISWRQRFRDFSYYISPNLSFARNKIKYMNEIDRYSPSGQYVPWAERTGRRIGEQFVYVFDHFVADQAEADKLTQEQYQPWGTLIPGDIVYKDIDDDGKITDQEDRVSKGHPRNPEIQFGIPLGVQYKGFDLSLLFQGATNTHILLTNAAAWEFPLFAQDIVGKVKPLHLGRWTPETASTATYPALHYDNNSNTKNSNSGFFLQDASYLRLKSIEIGYELPRDLVKKAGMSGVRFYVQGLNLITWDKLDKYDVDPETGSNGNWYPIQKVYNVGVNITF